MELPSRLGVQTGRGFVEEQQLRATDQTDGQVEPAPLPAGEHPQGCVCLVGQPDRRQQLVGVPGPGSMRGRVRDVVAGLVAEELTWPPLRVVAPRLQHDPQPGLPALICFVGVGAQHRDLAG